MKPPSGKGIRCISPTWKNLSPGGRRGHLARAGARLHHAQDVESRRIFAEKHDQHDYKPQRYRRSALPPLNGARPRQKKPPRGGFFIASFVKSSAHYGGSVGRKARNPPGFPTLVARPIRSSLQFAGAARGSDALFTNAGMNQFRTSSRLDKRPYNRAAICRNACAPAASTTT